MVDVCFGEAEAFTGVLAAAAIALEEALQSELEPLARDAVEGAEDDDGGDADSAVGGADGGVMLPDGKQFPIGP